MLSRSVVVPLVAVSGQECIEALLLAGFAISARNAETTTLVKGLRVVEIPDVDILPAEELSAILRAASVPYSEFLDYLSETPTEPALDRDTGMRRKVFRVPPGDAAAS